eukprot:3746484-Rhodomonas_salina.1
MLSSAAAPAPAASALCSTTISEVFGLAADEVWELEEGGASGAMFCRSVGATRSDVRLTDPEFEKDAPGVHG